MNNKRKMKKKKETLEGKVSAETKWNAAVFSL
jgi:hypothetical protein